MESKSSTDSISSEESNFEQIKNISGRVLQKIIVENFTAFDYIEKVALHGTNVYQLTKKGVRAFSKHLNSVKAEGYWDKYHEIEQLFNEVQSQIQQYVFEPFEIYRSSNFQKFRTSLKYLGKTQKTLEKTVRHLAKIKKKI